MYMYFIQGHSIRSSNLMSQEDLQLWLHHTSSGTHTRQHSQELQEHGRGSDGATEEERGAPKERPQV